MRLHLFAIDLQQRAASKKEHHRRAVSHNGDNNNCSKTRARCVLVTAEYTVWLGLADCHFHLPALAFVWIWSNLKIYVPRSLSVFVSPYSTLNSSSWWFPGRSFVLLPTIQEFTVMALNWLTMGMVIEGITWLNEDGGVLKQWQRWSRLCSTSSFDEIPPTVLPELRHCFS